MTLDALQFTVAEFVQSLPRLSNKPRLDVIIYQANDKVKVKIKGNFGVITIPIRLGDNMEDWRTKIENFYK